MSDIVLFKIDKFFSSQIKTTGNDFYADLLPGEATAIGFDLSTNKEYYDSIAWSFGIKIINPSKNDLVLRKISVYWKGINVFAESDRLIYYNEIIDWKNCKSIKNDLFEEYLPTILKAGTERKLRVYVNMNLFFKKNFLFKRKKIFYKSQIKEPDCYNQIVKTISIELLAQDNKVKIKI
jgi:hypothetical protein